MFVGATGLDSSCSIFLRDDWGLQILNKTVISACIFDMGSGVPSRQSLYVGKPVLSQACIWCPKMRQSWLHTTCTAAVMARCQGNQ